MRITLAVCLLLLAVRATASVPDALNFEAGWWNAWVTENPEPGARHDELIATLRDRVAALPEDRQLRGYQLLNRLELQLRRIEAGKGSAEPLVPDPVEVLSGDAVGWSAWLARERARRSYAAMRDTARAESDRTANAAARARHRYETLLLDFRRDTAPVAQRLLDGIELMTARAYWALQEQLAAQALTTANGAQEWVERLAEEVEDLRRRLESGGAVDPTDGEAAVEAARKTFAAAVMQREKLAAWPEAAAQLSQEQVRLLEQQALRAVVAETLARTMLLQAQSTVDAALVSKGGAAKTAAWQRLEARSSELSGMAELAADWRAASRLERAEAETALSAQLDAPEPAILLGDLQVTRDRLREAAATLAVVDRLELEVALTRALHDEVAATQQAAPAGITHWARAAGRVATGSYQALRDLGDVRLFSLQDTPVTIGSLLQLLLVLFAAWWVSRIVQTAMTRVAARRNTLNPASLYAMERVIHYAILALGFFIGLSVIGLNLSSFAIVAGALGVGIGFGLQSVFNNFISGLIILFERSLKVGDFVELGSGVSGEVKEINVRSTLINTNDNIDVLVPNSEFISSQMINWTLNEAVRRIHVSFGVAYGSDKEKVKQAALDAAQMTPHTLTGVAGREPQVWLVNFGDSSLDFELVVWVKPEAVKRPSKVNAEYLWHIETKLGEYGIEIPFPQRDLHLRSLFGERDQAALDLYRGTGGAS
ncbi:MAG: mechanosensitive ion channel domain-containing protein [Pseudomonadota bacterium]|nr:mechanosensitive ion channel domain-containing protein [Pseudomonadota bacterium]